jgi:amino acid adenylation domain-containing protein
MEYYTNQPENTLDKCFHQLFAERAEKTPQDIAIVYQNQQLTYSELNQRANQLAHYLQKLGVTSEVLVGLCLERSLETVIGILGILKAGGAYVALDPKYPQERIAFIVAETQLSILLTQQNLVSVLPQFDGDLICIDRDWENIVQESSENPVSPVTLQDLAYVIYTSGSTGKPKGVQIPHRNISDYVQAMSQAFQLNRKDTYLHTASFSFSSSVRQLMVPLSQGATVVIAAIKQIQTPLVLFELIQQRQITIIDLVPSYWRSCTELLENLATEERNQILDNQLRLILSASEPLLSDIPKKWRFDFNQDVSFINMYGQTETTGIVCVYPIPDEYEDKVTIVPIGRPIANTEIYILDEHLSPVPVGEVGEIHMSGSSLARSYFNRPDLTDEKFIPNPFSDSYGSRLYKAGDLARRLPDGTIKFVGRADYQVKIRGQRVELGEIESIIALYPGVKQTIVMGRDVSGDQRLVAYVVPKLGSNQETSQTVSIQQLRNYLKEKLPEYMVPSTFLILPAFPLTPTGKIDRRALPAPEDFQQELAETYVAPRNELEQQLAEIWEQVLGVHSIGINDNFFELGGHSLLVIQVITRIRKVFGIGLSIHHLFEAPTIAALSKVIEQHNPAERKIPVQKIQSVAHDIPLPLSFTQESLWFLWQLEPDSTYNISTAYHLTGQLNVAALSQSWTALVNRQEGLRTSFINIDGQGMQVVNPCVDIEIPVVDIQHLPENERQQEADKLTKEFVEQPFDLTVYPLWRVKLVRVAEEEYILLLTIHHIIFDDWSLGLLFPELASLYEAYLTNKPITLPELPIQYADFAVWQRQHLQGENLQLQLNYWQKQLAGIPPLLELPTDHPRPPVISYVGKKQHFELSKNLTEELRMLSQREGVTLFMMLLAAFQILLYRYSGQSDIVVGSPIAGRNLEENERIIGYFVNTLVLRNDLSGNPSFIELLGKVRQMALEAYEYQELPFDKVVECLNPERSQSYHPLFQVMFVLQTARKDLWELIDVNSRTITTDSETAKFDLTLELEETATGINGCFEYRTDLFDDGTVSRMVGHFQTLLESVVANPQTPIANLSLLTPQETQQLLVEWNQTQTDYPQDKCIHQLIEQQVEATPDAVAVVFEGQQLTYRDLNSQANQLARYLQSLGVSSNALVGISVERSLEMAVGFLGIFKAGAAYVPLDPSYPAERLAFMLEDSQASVILTQKHLLNILPEYQAKVICLDSDWTDIAQQSSENLHVEIHSAALAYIMYTSGSTGKPKGVMISHQGLVNHNRAIAKLFELKSSDRMLQSASISFDIAVEEIFPTWITGGSLILRNEEVLASTRSFLEFVGKEQITILDLPTALWNEIVNGIAEFEEQLPNSVRLLAVGGEKASKVTYLQWWDLVGNKCRWVNTYGPTEATVVATFYEPAVHPESQNSISEIPIGRPIDNTKIYILDQYQQTVPIGVPGELHIGGAGVAQGYLNRPDLTEEKFILNPFAELLPGSENTRLYRTNDKARYLSDGNIEFLGRLDNQVKIRGFRIELGEIETLVNQHPQIKESIIIVREDVPGDKRIVAYIVPKSEQVITEEQIRNYLKEQLPTYMIPSGFVSLESFPLTPNGKLDRRALPAPEYHRQDDEQTFVAPRNECEIQLAKIWQEVLNIQSISVQDNFFNLGGHSLLAVRLLTKIEKTFRKNLTLSVFFDNQTIEQLANLLSQETSSTQSKSLVTIKSGNGNKPPLFCIHALWGNILFYRDLISHLEPEQTVYGLEAQGLDGTQPPITSLSEMAAKYIQEIRAVQPNGPYYIAGHSLGGIVAFEMARQFHAQGDKVALLAILETSAPEYRESRLAIESSQASKIKSHLDELWKLSLQDKFNYIGDRLEWHLRAGKMSIFYKTYLKYIKRSLVDLRILEVASANQKALNSYEPVFYADRLTLFRAKDDQSKRFPQNPQRGWGNITTNVEVYECPGKHTTVMQEPNVKVMAEKLNICLAQKHLVEKKHKQENN